MKIPVVNAKNRYRPLSVNTQRGAALIVSLVILAVVTVLGVAGMRSTQTEMKMASSSKDRSIAFAAAEAALKIAEAKLIDQPPHGTQLLEECAGVGCFKPSCPQGFCFAGRLGKSPIDCLVNKGNAQVEFWTDKTLDIWNDPNKHLTVEVVQDPADASKNLQAKYIVEFMCYTKFDDPVLTDDPSGLANLEDNLAYMPLYRITARSSGSAGRAEVALQNYVRIANK